jgi:ABC-2 type transport system ATP-binding protein
MTARLGWNPYLSNPTLQPRLRRIRVPTLVVWGAQDRLVPVTHAYAYAEAIPDARLALIEALAHGPEVLLLDEPSLGLDYTSQLAYQGRIRDLVGSGVAVLLASNQVDEVEALCDRAAFLHRGEVIAEGTPEDLISRVEGVRRIVATLRNPVEYGSLAEIGGVERVVPEGGDLIFHCEERPGMVADVVGGIVRSGGDIVNLSVQRPNLEDVFVKLTREALRDED